MRKSQHDAIPNNSKETSDGIIYARTYKRQIHQTKTNQRHCITGFCAGACTLECYWDKRFAKTFTLH